MGELKENWGVQTEKEDAKVQLFMDDIIAILKALLRNTAN